MDRYIDRYRYKHIKLQNRQQGAAGGAGNPSPPLEVAPPAGQAGSRAQLYSDYNPKP